MKKESITREFTKAVLNKTIPSDPLLFFYSLKASSKGKPIKPFLHQAHLLHHAMLIRPVRFLIADEIGLGKTIEALAIARYLELMGEAKRILVLVPKILREQWREEIQRVGGEVRVIRSGKELEEKLRKRTEGYTVVSIDLAKKREHIDKILRVDWDLVIADEAHNITPNTQRYALLSELAKKKDRHILLLSATPHRGDTKDYLSRLMILDPTLVDDYKKLDKTQEFYPRTHDTVIFRRTKDVVDELEGEKVFKTCRFVATVVDITDEERAFFDKLENALQELIKHSKRGHSEYSVQALLAVLLRKRASSSYHAAVKTLSKIASRANAPEREIHKDIEKDIRKLFTWGYDEIDFDEDEYEIDDIVDSIIDRYAPYLDEAQRRALREVYDFVKRIAIKRDSKLDAVAKIVADHLKKNERVIIFTEFVDTLEYIYRNLPSYLKHYGIEISRNEILCLSGRNVEGCQDKKNIDKVGKEFETSGKILVSTDVASEGLNLQVASVLINYEAPWTPIKLEQRLGRIWRLGQERNTTAYTVFLANNMDMDVLESLYRKITTIREQAGEARPLVGKKIYVATADKLWNLELTSYEGDEKKKISEYDIILASLRKELSGYSEAIINMIKSLSYELEKKKVIPKARAEKIRKELARIEGERWLNKSNVEEVIKKYMKMLGAVEVHSEMLARIVRHKKELPKKIFVKSKDKKVYYLYLAKIKAGNQVVREVPVIIDENRVLHGVSLLEWFHHNVLSGEFITADYPLRRIHKMERIRIETKLKASLEIKIDEIWRRYRKYEDSLKSRGLKVDKLFRGFDIYLERITDIEFLPEKEFNKVKFIPPDLLDLLDGVEINPPSDDYLKLFDRSFLPLEKLVEAEKRAMEFVMKLEEKRLAEKYGWDGRGSTWNVEDVSLREHYDIKVVEGKDERYIEVKGHLPLLLTAEITEAERDFAEKHEDNYWIYIVANLGAGEGNEVVFKIFKPFNEKERRVFLVRDEKDVDVTDTVNVTITTKRRSLISVRN
ncbi:SNF2-related protein [Thermococcus sp. LS2]|uniref:SNF2-related protein n=1 Tax=Thermococcus sp. LS2 TaxID=1638260 RepID=UPI00143B4876|nr:SNF2-related protein [Thermococcus sp. LS2]